MLKMENVKFVNIHAQPVKLPFIATLVSVLSKESNHQDVTVLQDIMITSLVLPVLLHQKHAFQPLFSTLVLLDIITVEQLVNHAFIHA
jgi:hypothetical protein